MDEMGGRLDMTGPVEDGGKWPWRQELARAAKEDVGLSRGRRTS